MLNAFKNMFANVAEEPTPDAPKEKRRSKGKSKGSSFERKIAKYLTKWLTGTETPYAIWRTPMSGGMTTVNSSNFHMSGDLNAVLPIANEYLLDFFSIELKCGYDETDFFQFFKSSKGFNIEVFWKQCVRDANKANKHAMLIYKRTSSPALIILSECIGKKLNIGNIEFMTLNFKDSPSIAIMNMEEFFNAIQPKEFKKICKGIKLK